MKTLPRISHRRRLLGTFASILGVTSLTGCGSLRDDLTGSFCEGPAPKLVRGLEPAEPVDYVAIQSYFGRDQEPSTLQEEGACPATANCEALGAAPEEGGGMRGGFDGALEYVSYVRNDTVGHLLTLDEVRAFLGTIDTPSEAGLLVHLSGYHVDCDGNNFTQTGDGYIVYAQSGTTCGGDVSGHKLLVGPDGTIQELESEIVEHGDDNCQIGRIPTGLERSAKPERDGLGAFFAEVAHLEAASVAAFEDLAAELEHHGAPEALIRQARAAAREETRHAILTGALARRYGGERRIPRVQRQAPRDLEAIALDNAVEGLGRETFGALIGHHQALHATDPTIRSVMQTIALDETRHAELSHALHEWLCSQLSSAARDRVEHARRQALLRFRAGFCQEPSPELQRLAGLPSGAEATRMFDALFGGPV